MLKLFLNSSPSSSLGLQQSGQYQKSPCFSQPDSRATNSADSISVQPVMLSPSVSRVPQQSQNTANIFSSLIIFYNYMRCGVAQSVARVGNAVPDLRCHGMSYLLARSSLYESFAVTYPSDVILVIHTLSISWCAARGFHQRVLPIRRSVRTMRWSTPDVGRTVMCVARKGFGQSYSMESCYNYS